MNYKAVAFYQFSPIENPHVEVAKQHAFFEKRSAAGRIYISEQGINGQLSGLAEEMSEYIAWMRADARFSLLRFNIMDCEENIFPRMTIKYRQQLVAFDCAVDFSKRGTYVTPEEFRKALQDESKEHLLLDVRNRYEWEIGHFEGAELPAVEQFREFPAYAQKLKQEVSKETPIFMYCTGGIRCEIFSSLLKAEGFDNVFQLEGGVINYGLKEGSAHWKGKLFVFDDRLAVPIDGKQDTAISNCRHCGNSSDTYYNCANMDCNELFLCCNVCIEIKKGCCCEVCQTAPRMREYTKRNGNKPFRRKHLLDCKSMPKAEQEDQECALESSLSQQ